MVPREERERLKAAYWVALKAGDAKLQKELLTQMYADSERISTIYNPDWVEKRHEIIHRDLRCVLCGSGDRIEIDHITPVYEGGAELANDNLRVLCHACHKEKSRRELKDRWAKYGGA
jgi:hypothetical protein